MAELIRYAKFVEVQDDSTASSVMTAQTLSAVFGSLGTITALNSTSSPAVTKLSAGTSTMIEGTATIDLTSLPDLNGIAAAVSFSGLKVRIAVFEVPSTNAQSLTVTDHGTNGYFLFGDLGTGVLELAPGDSAMFIWPESTERVDIDATHKQLLVSGTTTDAVNYWLAAG